MDSGALAVGDDFSNSFPTQIRAVNDETGGRYMSFRTQLAPRYWRVWRDIGLGYAALAAILLAVSIPQTPAGQAVAALVGAVLVGYAIAFNQLFLHEAAHFNIAPSRAWNDRLADMLVSWQVGTSIKAYRTTHFKHHQRLGEPTDSESSYFNALTPAFLVRMLTGLHAVSIFLGRRERQGERGGSVGPLLRGALVHAALLVGLAAAGAWAAVAAWVLGMGVVYPALAALRQILEHRSPKADPSKDYSVGPHGAYTRLFGDDPFSATFGGAGFNRHLLHHWEPQISYTRLQDLERFLSATHVAPLMEARRTSYWRAFREIWRNDSRRA